MTYNEITTLFIWKSLKDKFGNLNDVPNNYFDKFWEENRNKMTWGTARKYVKANNQFSQLMTDFRNKTRNQPHNWLLSQMTSEDPVQNYKYQFFKEQVCGKPPTIFNISKFFFNCFVVLYRVF